MKKSLLVLLCLLAVSLISCGEKKDGSSSSEAKSSSKKTQKMLYTKFIYSGYVVYEEQDDGKMYAVVEAEIGDDVRLYTNSDGSVEMKNAVRKIKSTGEEAAFDFVHISYNDTDYWTRELFIAPEGCTEAYITLYDAMTYSKPDGISMTSTMLKEGTVCPATKFSKTDDYAACYIYDGNPYGKEIYVSTNYVSDDPSAIEYIRTFSRMETVLASSDALDDKHYDETVKVMNTLAKTMIKNVSSYGSVYSWLVNKVTSSETLFSLLDSDVAEYYLSDSYYDDYDDYYDDDYYDYEGDYDYYDYGYDDYSYDEYGYYDDDYYSDDYYYDDDYDYDYDYGGGPSNDYYDYDYDYYDDYDGR